MFVSISLDLVGSTPLKRAMFRYGDPDFDELRAVGKAFISGLLEVWHLYSKHTLREEIYLPDKDLIDYLASTRAFLAREGFYGIDRAGA